MKTKNAPPYVCVGDASVSPLDFLNAAKLAIKSVTAKFFTKEFTKIFIHLIYNKVAASVFAPVPPYGEVDDEGNEQPCEGVECPLAGSHLRDLPL